MRFLFRKFFIIFYEQHHSKPIFIFFEMGFLQRPLTDSEANDYDKLREWLIG